MCFVKPDTLQGATDAYNAGESNYNGYQLAEGPGPAGGPMGGMGSAANVFHKSNGMRPGTLYFKDAPSSAAVVRNGNTATYMPPSAKKSFMPGPSENFNPRVIS